MCLKPLRVYTAACTVWGMNTNWQTIGGGVHMLKANRGHYHAMQHAKTAWTLSWNGRIIGTAKTLDAAKELANHALSDGA